MDEYRLYFVDGEGQRLSVFDFASIDDERGEAAGRQFGCERGAELWCGGRQVGGWLRADAPGRGPSLVADDAAMADAA
jgi:hypothetical protein